MNKPIFIYILLCLSFIEICAFSQTFTGKQQREYLKFEERAIIIADSLIESVLNQMDSVVDENLINDSVYGKVLDSPSGVVVRQYQYYCGIKMKTSQLILLSYSEDYKQEFDAKKEQRDYSNAFFDFYRAVVNNGVLPYENIDIAEMGFCLSDSFGESVKFVFQVKIGEEFKIVKKDITQDASRMKH